MTRGLGVDWVVEELPATLVLVVAVGVLGLGGKEMGKGFGV